MKVRIVSNGTAYGTRIENAETGELVENVVGVQWEAGIHGIDPARATLQLIGVEIDVIGHTTPEEAEI